MEYLIKTDTDCMNQFRIIQYDTGDTSSNMAYAEHIVLLSASFSSDMIRNMAVQHLMQAEPSGNLADKETKSV